MNSLMNSYVGQHRQDIQHVASKHGATHVRVFGSFAREDAHPDSDLDLLVEMASGRSLLDVIAIRQDLEDLLGRSVDVVTEAALSPYIRDEVLSQAVPL